MAAQWAERFSHRLSKLAVAARRVTLMKEHPTHIILSDFAANLDDFANVWKELQRELEVHEIDPIKKRELEVEVAAVEQLIISYKSQCELSLLLCCPFLLGTLQSVKANLSKALGFVKPDTCNPLVKLQVLHTQRQLEQANPQLGMKEQIVIDTLGRVSTSLLSSNSEKCKELAQQVAQCLGVSLSSSAFANHLRELKTERGKVEISEDDSFFCYMDQCILLLEAALASQNEPLTGINLSDFVFPSPPNRHSKRLVAPFPSFICPITKKVMVDPVQIASGQTYERAAIAGWFKENKKTNPLGEKLKNTKMKSNLALRQSITEWREGNFSIRMDNAELQLRSSQPMEQARGARELRLLCEEDVRNKYATASKNLIPLLIRLVESSSLLREVIFETLYAVAQDHHENQEILVKEGIIDVIVRCLRTYDEAQPAVLLLELLSEDIKIAEMISRTPDAVLLLVTFLGHKNEALVISVKGVLVNLPTTDENIVIMGEANLVKPLVTRLVEGDAPSKVLMASTLGRLDLMPGSKAVASTSDSIFTLTNMMNSAQEDEVAAAVKALENLSTLPSVCKLIAECSGLKVLNRLLTSSETSVGTKIGASHVAANLFGAIGNDWPDWDTDLDSFIKMFLKVISLAVTPPSLQGHLLRGLLGLVEGNVTSGLATARMKNRNIFPVLIPFLTGSMPLEVRQSAVKLFASLSAVYSEEACTAIKLRGTPLQLFEMLRGEDTTTESEMVAAANIISNLPLDDTQVNSLLQDANIVPFLVKLLDSKSWTVTDAAAGALVRFTSPKNVDLQKSLAELGVLQKFVALLDSGRPFAKESAAKALANFSTSTPRLVQRVAMPKWWQCFSPKLEVCRLHAGVCSIENTFCLLEADAVTPLLVIIQENDSKAAEAALLAVSTIVDESHWKRGCKVIEEARGIPIIINNLSTGSPLVQEISVDICEKFFRLPEYHEKFGLTAQMHIITLVQQGAPKTKDVAGKILRQLKLLHSQSHYFGYNSTR